jgi:hypothetical protein
MLEWFHSWLVIGSEILLWGAVSFLVLPRVAGHHCNSMGTYWLCRACVQYFTRSMQPLFAQLSAYKQTTDMRLQGLEHKSVPTIMLF